MPEAQNAASGPSRGNMPLFYNSIVPLQSAAHRNLVLNQSSNRRFAADCSSIPVTIDEVAVAQTDYPIVFTAGEEPFPIILTGLPERGNQFLDKVGQWREGAYVPAYVRRYPFLLAKAEEGSDRLTLCMDMSADCFTQEAGKGNLFDGEEPSALAKDTLKFCEHFEAAVQRTRATMEAFRQLDLLMDAQAQLRQENGGASRVNGFQIISQEKLQQVPGDKASELVKSGGMALIYAHLFSIRHMEHLMNAQAENAKDATARAPEPEEMATA